jgi:uncharacterized damage-inducible protein DinB
MTATASTLLGEALTAWADAREGVIAEVQNIPDDAFEFRPTDANRTLNVLVLHIIQSGLMMSGELSRPDGDFQRTDYPGFIREYMSHVEGTSGKKKLLDLLESTHRDGAQRLERSGEIHMLQTIRQFNGAYATRLSWMYHGIAHEEYHRGQIALYARQLGKVPALTQLIHGL